MLLSRAILLLLALLLLLCAILALAEDVPNQFAHACKQTDELHIVLRPGSPRAATMRYRACLLFDRTSDDPIRLNLNATGQSLQADSSSRDLLLFTFKIPSKNMRCRFAYQWKLEEVPAMNSTDALQPECTDSNYDECRVMIGQSPHCQHYPMGSTPIKCASVPGEFNFLYSQCLLPTAAPPPNHPLPLAVTGAVVGVLLVGVLVGLRLVSKPPANQDRVVPVFEILDNRHIGRVLRHRMTNGSCSFRQTTAGNYEHLLQHPDTADTVRNA